MPSLRKRRLWPKKRAAGGTPLPAQVKAFDMTDSAPQSWFNQARADGFRLYVYPPLAWGVSTPRSDAQQLFQFALNAGLLVGAYSRNPTWWSQAIAAVGPLKNRLQFFALDIETDPGVPVTRAMVNGVAATGVRPIIYSGWGMWPSIMGGSTAFSDVPLWCVDTGSSGSFTNFATYTPNVLVPALHAYGGWNTGGNNRIGCQQAFEVNMNGKFIDTNSFYGSFLTVP